MRILAVGNRYPPPSNGGYEVMAAGAVEALRRSGHEVTVLTTLPDPSDRQPAATAADHDVSRELRWYWREHRFPPISLRDTIALERHNATVLARHLAGLDPELVLWWAMGGMSLSLLTQVKRAGVPAVGVVGDEWLAYGPAVDGWTRRFRGRRAALAPFAERLTGVPAIAEPAIAARWVFISEHLRSEAEAAGISPADSVVAHPGVDPARFAPRAPEPWRWRLLYCGRIDPRKGIATAIEALAELPPEAQLTIDGDGDRHHAAELAALADRLGLGPRVSFRCSEQPDVPAAYADADAIVFPVRWKEPWGLVPLEAMSVGRPVLASRAGGGAAEYLRDGENCLQFAPGDATALASAVLRLAGAPELRSSLIRSGAETAARFTDRGFHEALERELISATQRQRVVR